MSEAVPIPRNPRLVWFAAAALALCAVLCAPRAEAAYAAVAACAGVATSPNGTGNAVTAALNCTGVDLLVVAVSYYSNRGSVLSDNSANGATQWTQAKHIGGTGPPYSTADLYYVQAPTVSASQIFTATSVGTSYPALAVQGFTGSVASPLDGAANGAAQSSGVSTTLQPGAVSPIGTTDLVVSGMAGSTTITSLTVTSPTFTQSGQAFYNGTNYIGVALYYLLAAGATSVNPVWTFSTTSDAAVTIAAFKTAAGGGGIAAIHSLGTTGAGN